MAQGAHPLKPPSPARVVAARRTGTLSAGAAAVLLDMEAAAAVVFAGYVTKVERQDANGYVDVSFRVEEPVRGCNKLGTYVLREWAGLWSAGPARYVAGQHLLMLLPARGPGGMSAPIGGSDGAIPLLGAAAEPLAGADGVATPDAGTEAGDVNAMLADLRWLQTRVKRLPAYASAADAGRSEDWAGPVTALSGASAAAPSTGLVLTLLRGASATGANGGGAGHEVR